ncbi:MAG: 5,10-methylenetetrahydrofolate reductase [Candidatus Omnitrophica bacterium CG11_big_fil_rev_8_21_14_0_20_63_9]|nr:MAG: 5,10-methylenetetrahydrofolate reductase [Candidatus Omnitrophica bacterium CG11_big_fil_rev_8_21_14_0_20_63_9]
MTPPALQRFETKLGKKFVVTMEVNPPKGTDLSEIVTAVERVRPLVDAINVTDGSGAMMRACSLAVAKVVLDAGVDPILQMTCRDRNRLALQADLLGAAILGIQNVLLLTGDDPKAGDHPDAKPVFDINSAALMQVTRGLTQGVDMAGKTLSGVPHFCIGAAADPGAKDLEVETQKFKAKIDGGAAFFQTQAVFDAEPLRRFMERVRPLGKPVLAGILLVKSAKMARYMNEHVWGIHVPEPLIARFEQAQDKRAECVAATAELIRAVRDVADGIHLYALGWEDLIPDILKEADVVRA